MGLTSARAVLLVACLGWTGCTVYNPSTGLYETDPVGTSLVAGGLGMAGGVALGAALADHNDCCWGGGYYHGGDVNVYNNYNRTANYNKNRNANYNRNNANYNRNGNRNRANYGGGRDGRAGGGRGGYGGGGRARGGGRRR